VLEGVYFFRTSGYFGQFHSIQLDSQLSCQTLKLGTAAFSVQQLSLHSSFPCTASHRQPKQTGPRYLVLILHLSHYMPHKSMLQFFLKRSDLKTTICLDQFVIPFAKSLVMFSERNLLRFPIFYYFPLIFYTLSPFC
jgi:hypothetical protein